MKKILVPIDYLPHSDNAVNHAIQIAEKIKARIHIFHAVEAPNLIPMPGLMIWTDDDYPELKKEADAQLERYITQIRKSTASSSHNLSITFSTSIGWTKQSIAAEMATQQPDLVVMGMEAKSMADRIFLGSTSREMIKKSKVPLLLIPSSATYKPLKKIAFATDLSASDLDSIQNLLKVFNAFRPEIILIHVDRMPADTSSPLSPISRFLEQVISNIEYDKIYFRDVTDIGIENGLNWLSTIGWIDVLAMVRRRSGVFSRLLTGSHTQKMAKSVHLPLLVIPEGRESLTAKKTIAT